MKTIILTLTCFSLFTFKSISQNPLFTVAPDYIDFEDPFNPLLVSPLPTDSPFDFYYGQLPNSASNSMVDSNGDLLFFVVDNNILLHDKNSTI